MDNQLTFRVFFEDYRNVVSVMIGSRDVTGKLTHMAAPVSLNMEPHEPGMMILSPSMQFSPEEATHFMTALWEAGIRPHNFQSPDGEVRRLNDHLQDMRKLVFKDES